MESIWQGAFQELSHYFSEITLQTMMNDYERLSDIEPIMFNI